MPISHIVDSTSATCPSIMCSFLMASIQAIEAKSCSLVVREGTSCRNYVNMAAGSVAQKDASSLNRVGFCLSMREEKVPYMPFDQDVPPGTVWPRKYYFVAHAGQSSRGLMFWFFTLKTSAVSTDLVLKRGLGSSDLNQSTIRSVASAAAEIGADTAYGV